ncbi:ADP-ribosylglycohydrolase family protein [Algoriphagus litoralis]|uniref:ADP-ribosylglycohydrolase family protein n=1 Tax=Algoriphagus litoralis TaxID=2202829 RepID=UPI000DBAD828|nr:ADP-ribosylglycohydrolase family protein [Algoriphagus litoralis]
MRYLAIFLLPFFLFACGKKTASPEEITFSSEIKTDSGLSESELYDKVLGMLVGSAIGDAMGAPTEMWSRESIQLEYGFVDGLDSMVREVSPEGTWKPNLPAGGTTDDTRWKVLTATYLLSQSPGTLDPKEFASHIYSTYEDGLKQFKSIESSDPEPYEAAMLEMNWLSEWAKVSKPYLDNNLTGYADSLSKFYGGEMVCAGLLYAPALGVFFPGDPSLAYQEGFKLSIFDLGYARDLSALAVAMTAAGMKPNAKKEDLLATLRIDSEGFFQSRLVGRTSHRILKDVLWINSESKKLDSLSHQLNPTSPALAYAFSQLDQKQQDMPFHAGEIYLQTLLAMVYTDFDFENTLSFLVNYGRDNDTTAALAGGILGAWYGYEKLPKTEREKVLKVNQEELGIDLEELAQKLTSHILKK